MLKRSLLGLVLLLSCGQGELWYPGDMLDAESCIDYTGSDECYLDDLGYIASSDAVLIGRSSQYLVSSSVIFGSSSSSISISSSGSSVSSSTISPLSSSSILVSSSSTLVSSSVVVSSSVQTSSIGLSSSISVMSSAGCSYPLWAMGNYVAGDIVTGSDGSCYECKAYPYSGWCGSNLAYAPISGWAWGEAWTRK